MSHPHNANSLLETEIVRLKEKLRQCTAERDAALHTISSLRRRESAAQREYAKLLKTVNHGEDHLGLALEAGKLGSWDWGIRKDSITLSERTAKILGLPGTAKTDYQGFLRAIHRDDRVATDRTIRAAIKSGGVYEMEFRVCWPDGSIHWVSATGRALSIGDQKPCRALGLVRDITAKKLHQQALQASEALANARAHELETLMDAAPAGIFVATDPDCQHITANRAGTAMLRLAPGQLVRQKLPGVDPLATMRVFSNGVELQLDDLPMFVTGRTGQMTAMHLDLMFSDGVIRAIYGTAAPLHDEQGRVRGVVGSFVDITEQRLAEKELARSRRLFERMAATVPDVLYVFDLNQRSLVYANRPHHELLGYTPETFYQPLATPLRELIHPDDRANHALALRAMHSIADGETHECEYRVRQPDATYRWVRLRVVAFSRNHDHSVSQILGLARDTTPEHQTLEALQKSQDLYRIVTDLSTQIVWRTNSSGELDYCNENWCRLTGLTLEQSKNGGWTASIHPDHRELIRVGWANAVSGQREYQLEIPIRRADGSYRWFMGHTIPVRNTEGKIIHWLGSAYDNHERKEAEQALRESERRFRMLADTAPVMIWMTNERGDYTYVNQQTLAFTGQHTSQPFANLPPHIHPEDFPRGFQSYLAALRAKISFRADYRQRRHDGNYRWITCHGQPRLSSEGAFLGFIGIMLDITDRKHAEQTLREHQHELQSALTLAQNARQEAEAAGRAKDQFLAVLSHELRTPLTPVLIALATIRRQKDLPPRVYEAMEMIRSNIQLEARLIDDLLDLTHINRATMELAIAPLDLHQTIQRAVTICSPELAEKSHQLTLALDATHAAIDGDSTKLQQVFWNLLKNAIKFTNPGGHIQLRTSNHGARILIEFEDNGIGIDPAVLPVIFNSFEQGSQDIVRQYGGLGLGLAISKAIVERHGGSLRASSAGKDTGALFTIELQTTDAP